MPMRITGLATGLDMDQLIKETMRPHRIKIQQVQQNKEVAEIRQTLYREIIKDSREFYNKYLDIAKSDSLLLSKNWSNVKYTSADEGAVTVKALSGAKADNYTVEIQQLATSAKATLATGDIQSGDEIIIRVEINGKEEEVKVNTKTEDVDGEGNIVVKNRTNSEIVSELNTKLKDAGSDITATNSAFAQGIVLETKLMGSDAKFYYELTGVTNANGDPVEVKANEEGQNANIIIRNSSGTEYPHTRNTNSLTLDGVQFIFNDTSIDGNPIRVTGKVDASDIKDKLVSFINDYNTLLEKFNTLTMERRNRNFMPLTAEQKSEMSEAEIRIWESKVKTGQLNRDSDLTRIANQMKDATKAIFGGNMTSLKAIGITPVSEYSSTKNGTLTIDEDKLIAALENNAEDVRRLFTGTSTATATDEKYTNTGIAQRIKNVLYNETMVSSARLLKKVGIEGSSTVANNELSKSIEKYERRMSDMEKSFSRREQLMYTKYAKIESMMNKLNAQQSYLMSQLGMG